MSLQQNRITLVQLKNKINTSKKFQILNCSILCGHVYIYKQTKDKKFPLFKKGQKFVLKYIGDCYDESPYCLYDRTEIYIVDKKVKKSDMTYQVITKKEFYSNRNDISSEIIFINRRKVYVKKINMIGIDTKNLNNIFKYFNN